MAVNDLTLNQVSTVLAEVVSQATGQKEKAPSIAASCFFVVRLAHSYPNGLTNIPHAAAGSL